MAGTTPEMESIKSISFPEAQTNKTISPGCIDGRPDKESKLGFQMLGGSLHPMTVEAIMMDRDLTPVLVEDGISKLRKSGIAIGVHRGHHRNAEGGKSDCGFADRLPEIINSAKNNRVEILKKLNEIYETNKFPADSLPSSYDLLSHYDPAERIKIKGEPLIALFEANNANIENLEGDHRESAVFVNVKPYTTLNRIESNKLGKPAFNLDLGPAIEQTEALMENGNPKTIRDLSLILYMTTLMVLQGKPVLDVTVHH
jgi:hypothetical protein